MIQSLLELLTYNPAEPLIFTSGLFLFLFLGFSLIYSALVQRVNLRIAYVTLFSLYFYYKTSGLFFLLLIFTATSDFLIARAMGRAATQKARRWWLLLSVVVNVGMLGYFKYTNFLVEIVNNFLSDPLEFQNIFLPIGISFFTFQSMSYTIDAYRGRIEPLRNWGDYLFYVSFFPQLVAGPIVRARDFIPQIRQQPLVVSRAQFGEAFFLIFCGLLKKAVISDYISLNFVDRIFDDPTLYTGLENLMGVLGYALQIYCDFSGYSDMAIGLALLLGFRFNANFDSPYKSASITEFWRRWHISLSNWLKDYLYISLGGNRHGRIRTYINLLLTMLIGGLWHGAALQFVVWGGWHGAGLAGHKGLMELAPRWFKQLGEQMKRPARVLGIVLTFSFVCVGWIFFRADSMATGLTILERIGGHFHPEIWLDFLSGYRWVVLLMVMGYLFHFAPKWLENRTLHLVQRMPIVLYAVMMSLLIWTVVQMRSGDVQPFIYFQF